MIHLNMAGGKIAPKLNRLKMDVGFSKIRSLILRIKNALCIFFAFSFSAYFLMWFLSSFHSLKMDLEIAPIITIHKTAYDQKTGGDCKIDILFYNFYRRHYGSENLGDRDNFRLYRNTLSSRRFCFLQDDGYIVWGCF